MSQVKLTVQGEVANSSTILQQTFVVEYIVNGQMCDECRRVEAKDTWNASVSLALAILHIRSMKQ
jgi:nonsense-mediated mRNA decay protein 3